MDVDLHKEVSYGKVGEICFMSPSTMQCYYGNDEATVESIELDEDGNRWLHTGDLGYMDEEGFVFFKGRIKRIYMTLGSDGFAYKLFPQRIEEFFCDMDGVELCGCVVKDDTERLHVAHAFIKLKPGKQGENLTIQEIRKKMLESLPEHPHPETIRIIASMSVTPSGKIDYHVLEKMV